MRFTIHQELNEWVITARDGEFAGCQVAQAEGLCMTDVTFASLTMTGVIQASWGLTILVDDVTTSRETLRALGVGRTFDSPAEIPFASDGSMVFICSETGRALREASNVMIYNRGKFYG